MSSIDERIVQMRFDNKDFESNVGTTMSTLEKLKEKLKFTKSDEGIQNLKNSFNGFNFSGMESGIDSLNNKFSALGIAGMEVIRRITNAAIDMGERVAKAFTIEPVMDGFAEYELKIGSIQTILMGAHTREGLPVTLEMVNQKLNELNTYADKTIYSFSDMTQNIGKFTNAGVSLEDSVDAIQGIANVAALSGANAQQASHAMYNFAQALSSGSVKLIDWKSIENAQMATVEFKQALIDTATEVGTLVKEGDQWVSTTTNAKGEVSEAFDATSKFNDSLNAQWMTTEVLTKTLARYSDETDELGKKAFEAATQVKTWSQLKDTVKEALGSGWAQTWEYIIGDFNEAKELWTGLNNIISGIIDPIADARNEMFKFWHDNGGRDAMLQAFNGLWNIIQNIGNGFKSIAGDFFERVFGKFDGARLVSITESIRDFFNHFIVSVPFVEAISTVVETFFNVLETGVTILSRVGHFISLLWEAIEPGRMALYGIITSIGEVISVISALISRISNVFERNGGLQALANGLGNLFNGLVTLIQPAVQAVHDFFWELAESPFAQRAGEFLADLAKKFEEFTESIDFAAIADTLYSALDKLWGVISKIGEYIGVAVSSIWDFVKGIFGIGEGSENAEGKLNSLKGVIDNIKTTLINLKENAVQWFLDHAPDEMIQDVSTAIEKLNGFLQPLKDKIGEIKESLQDGSWYSKLKDWLVDIIEKIGDLKDAIVNFIGDKAVQAFTAIWDGIADAFNKFVDAIKTGWGFIKKVWKSLFGDDLYTAVNRIFEFLTKLGGIKALFTFTDILDGLSNITGKLDDFATNLKDVSINVEKALLAPLKSMASKNRSEAIRNLAISIAILTASLIALSFVEFDKIQTGILAVGEMLTMLLGFFAILNKLTNQTSEAGRGGLLGALIGNNGASALKSNALGFISLAASIFILSTSLAKLAGIPFLDLQKGLLAIAELMAGLYLFSKYVKEIKVGAIDTAALGIAIDLIAQAVAKIGSLDFESWIKGLGGLALVFIELTAFLHDIENVSVGGFAGLIALAAAVRVLVMSVKALGDLDLDDLIKGLGGVAIMLIELYAFCKQMETISTAGFAGIIVLAVGLRLLTTSVSALGSLDFETLLKGLGGVAILLIELSAFMHDMQGISGMSIAAAAAMVVMAAALRILCNSVEDLGAMSTGSMIQGLVGVAASMLIFVAACKLLDDVSPKILVAAAAMVVMAAAVDLIVPAIKALGGMPFADVVQGIAAVAAVFVIFGAAGAILGPLAGQMIAVAAAMAIMSAALYIAIPPIMAFGSMPLENIGKALLTLAGIFVIFGAAGALLGPLAPMMLAAAAGILALSAAAAAAGGAMLVVAAGIEALGHAIMVAMDAILALLQSILGGLPFIGDDIDKWISERRAVLNDNMDPEEAKQTGEDWITGLGDGITSSKDLVSGAADDVTSSLTDSLAQATETATASGQQFGTNIFEGYSMSDLQGLMSGDMSGMTGMLGQLMNEGGMDAGSMFGEGFADSDVTSMIESMLSESGTNSGMNFGEAFTTADPVSYVLNSANEMANTVAANAKEMYLAGEFNGKELLEGMSDGASAGLPGFYQITRDGIKYLTEDTLTSMRDAGEITGEEYARAMADRVESGYGIVISTTQDLADRVGTDTDMVRPAEDLGDSFVDSLSNYGIDVERVVSDWGSSAGNGLSDAASYFSEGGDADGEAFIQALMDYEGEANSEGQNLGYAAADGMYDAEWDAYRAGQDVAYGFGDGVSSTSYYAENAAARMARDALDAMRRELDVNSPSKETRKLGRFGGLGLGVGFKDATSYVRSQASNLADKGLFAMQSTMERLRDSLNFSSDMQPTIAPVLDLSQIQNGVRMMGSMLGSSQLAVAGAFGMDPYAFSAIRSVTSTAERSPSVNGDVVGAIGSLQDEISTLKSAMESMKFEADGKVIGQVAYREVDRRLGNSFVRNRREGRG